MKSGFIYEWLDVTTSLKYIGRHEGHIDDGYIGSGSKFNEQYNLRPSDFVRSIIWYSDCVSSEDIIEQEFKILANIPTDELYFGKNRKYYNIVNNSGGYTSEFNPMKNPEIVAKMMATRARKGNHKSPWENRVAKYGYEISCELCKLGDKTAGGKANKNIPKSEEHKKNISTAIKLSKKDRINDGRPPVNTKDELVNIYNIYKTFKKAAESIGISESAFKGRYYLSLKRNS